MPSQGQNKRRLGQEVDKPAKRSRVSRACDQCRTAREKCDGVQPTCFTCSASKRACTYTANPKKRGIQPGYIRSLELALTWLFQNTESEVLLHRKLLQEGNSSVLLGRDSKESNKLHRSWRRSRFSKDLDKLLSGGEISGQGLPDDGGSPESDEDESDTEQPNLPSTVDYTQSNLTLLDESSPIIRTRPSIDVNTISRNRVDSTRHQNSPWATSSQHLISRSYILPANSFRLLDIYFAYTHCWLPICEKHDVLKWSYSYPETGLSLSAHMPGSGDHAELWSILAVASCQERLETHQNEAPIGIEQMYDIARSLIPTELHTFEVGHVKALLNLAIASLNQSMPEAAWLLVGSASRILLAVEHMSQGPSSKRKHVFAGCFLLDRLLSSKLRRRPYLHKTDTERVGTIDEEGLEEWQPWIGCFNSSHPQQSRTPVLSLSSFNNLLEVVDILDATEQSIEPRSSPQEILARLDLWKASLPQKFDYIRTERVPTPLTPPAILLHLAFYCASLALFPSQSWIHRIIELLDRAREQLGVVGIPPIANCFIESIKRNNAYAMLDPRVQIRIQKVQADITQVLPTTTRESPNHVQGPPSAHSRHSFGAAQMPTPESIQIPFNPATGTISNPPVENNRPRTSSTLLDDLLPDMQTTAHTPRQNMGLQNFNNVPPFEPGFNQSMLEHRNSAASRDIESFFDDLASLDGAEKLENQPQFMQNLGFAPDANMADFLAAEFSQFIPMHSSTFQPQSSNEPTQFEPNAFYDAS